MKKQTTKLRFSEADLESPGIRKAAEKAEKAVEKADDCRETEDHHERRCGIRVGQNP